jgi:hypothetical protein
MLRYNAPLNWPDAIQATPRAMQRSDHGFNASIPLADACRFLEEEMVACGITDAVVYTDIEQPLVERLRKKLGNRTGACLHINYKGQGYVVTCDRWITLEHNVYALHLVFRNWQSMIRWGVGTLDVFLAGFATDHTPSTLHITQEMGDALQFFGLGSTATLDDALAIYHRRAKLVAGDQEALTKINLAMDELRHYFGKPSLS